MTKIGYARVSTSGQDLELQIEELTANGCTEIFSEKMTGAKLERTEFQRMLSMLQPGDVLTVTKIDRFARSTIDALQTVKDLLDRGISVHILNMGLMEDTPTGKLTFTMFSAFAEFERDLILERMQAGKEAAKIRKGSAFQEGRPPLYKKSQKQHAVELLKTYTYAEVEALTGMSKSTLIRAVRKEKGGA